MTLDLTHLGKNPVPKPPFNPWLANIVLFGIVLVLAFFISSCEFDLKTGEVNLSTSSTSTLPSAVPTTTLLKANCETIKETLTLRNQTALLPKSGRFVVESHLAAKEDTFANGRLLPSFLTEGAQNHLKRACAALHQLPLKKPVKADCSDVYDLSFKKVWTPPEAGLAGQGAVGNLKPNFMEEMWSGNMYWKTKPKPGTRYLIKANGKAVVIVMGYETGPMDSKYLGGLQPEPHWYLGTTGSSLIEIGKLANQALPPGPINCP